MYVHKRLCIVENGEALGGCSSLGIQPDICTKVDTMSVSAARNEGLYAVRSTDADAWVSMMDDDDWYGPEYLREVSFLVTSGRAEVYGKQRHFVALPSKGLCLFQPQVHDMYVPYVHGPTLSFRAADSLLFLEQKEAEEITWCCRMRALGARVYTSSVYHMLYMRRMGDNAHTWKASDRLVARASSGGRPWYNAPVVDLDVVCGRKSWSCTRVDSSTE